MRKPFALLKVGSKCPEVSYAKRMINLASARRSYGFRWDTPFNEGLETFTQQFQRAVLAFQKAAGFTGTDVDGVIGNQTWGALGVQLAISYPIRMVPQPKPHTCFECATKMVQNGKPAKFGKTRHVAIETAHDRLVEITPSGKRVPIARDSEPEILRLFVKGGLWMGSSPSDVDENNLRLYGRRNGWQSFWPPTEDRMIPWLAESMGQAPVMAGGFLYQAGQQDYPGHAVVIGSLWTDWTPEGTLVKVFDPYPVGRGRIYATDPTRFYIAGRPFDAVIYYVPGQAHQKSQGVYQIWEDNIPKY